MMQEERLKRILGWFRNGTSLPFKLVLIPTNRCNLKCSYCPNALPRWKGKFRASEELSAKEWKRVIDDAIELDIKEYSIIGGGEPFLRKDIVLSLVKRIKKIEGTDCEIITNGTLLDATSIEKLVKVGLDRILFSIDGPWAKIHDYLRGVEGAFRRVAKNLETFGKLKKKLKKDKPYLKINMVLNKENFRLIEEMVKFVYRAGGQELALHPMREYFELEELKSLSILPQQKNILKKEIERAKKIAKNFGIFLNTDMVEMEEKNIKKIVEIKKSKFAKKIEKCYCFEPFYTMLIDPKGFVGGCSPAGSGIKSLNVKEKSLKEIWFSKELSSIRNLILKGKKFDYCSKCGLTDLRVYIKKDLLNFISQNFVEDKNVRRKSKKNREMDKW